MEISHDVSRILGESGQTPYLYTDKSPAAIGDRIEFRYALGDHTSSIMQATGTITSMSNGQVAVDISPRKYRRNMGRFGTVETSTVTIHAKWKQNMYVIAEPNTAYSLGVNCQFDEWAKKI